jgi:hypothetical protein
MAMVSKRYSFKISLVHNHTFEVDLVSGIRDAGEQASYIHNRQLFRLCDQQEK